MSVSGHELFRVQDKVTERTPTAEAASVSFINHHLKKGLGGWGVQTHSF